MVGKLQARMKMTKKRRTVREYFELVWECVSACGIFCAKSWEDEKM